MFTYGSPRARNLLWIVGNPGPAVGIIAVGKYTFGRLAVEGFIRVPVRLALVVAATGVAAALLVIRKPSEEPAEEYEPTADTQAAVETEADNWFV